MSAFLLSHLWGSTACTATAPQCGLCGLGTSPARSSQNALHSRLDTGPVLPFVPPTEAVLAFSAALSAFCPRLIVLYYYRCQTTAVQRALISWMFPPSAQLPNPLVLVSLSCLIDGIHQSIARRKAKLHLPPIEC